MANLLKLRLGVSDDPTALQPSLNDCLEAMLQRAEFLMADVINGLLAASAATGPRRIAALQLASTRLAIEALKSNLNPVCATFKTELSRVVYEGGGKDHAPVEALRFEDLQLFGDTELDLSIELARAQQEVAFAVDGVLPKLDALISTLMGWRTIQPGLNPLRPDAFVRALQCCLALHVPQVQVREALITPAAGMLGVNLRNIYRELSDWLHSTGVEPAVPIGGKLHTGSGATGAAVPDSMAKTLLTLDKLRKLLAGGYDGETSRGEYAQTVPASMAMLLDMKQVEVLVKRLEQRPKPLPESHAVAAVRPLVPHEPMTAAEEAAEAIAEARLGRQLGEEVVHLMFDNLALDQRLLPAYKRQLQAMQPAVLKLTQQDSRFFSDRSHPARQFLDRMTQRSLAFPSENDEGWLPFVESVEEALRWLESKVIDAETFGEMLDHLQVQWTGYDQLVGRRGDKAAQALSRATQRASLAQQVGEEFTRALQGRQVPEFILEFLTGSWAQVVAEAQLVCVDGSPDPSGYRTAAGDLLWSVQDGSPQEGRTQRLMQMIPALLAKLREGLARIDTPPELTKRFFDRLITIHRAALVEGRDPATQVSAEASEWQVSEFPDSVFKDSAAVAPAGPEESSFNELDSEWLIPEDADVLEPGSAGTPTLPGPDELFAGTWVELLVKGEWLRVQLTWASPRATLFMFTSPAGTAHSMSRRQLERLREKGRIQAVGERNVVDEALDLVAQAALKNSLRDKK